MRDRIGWSRAIVVGASSGIGEAIAVQLAAAGTHVVTMARRGEELDNLARNINGDRAEPLARAMVCDTRDWRGAPKLFADAVEWLGGLDLLVYSSGVMPPSTREGFVTSEDINAVETNLSGAIAWINEAAGYFLKSGRGTIIGVSSIAGVRGRASNPVYNATKSALSTYLESLSYRLSRQGVTVLDARPGLVRTAMMGSREVMVPVASPERAARDTLRGAARGKRVIYTPWWWRLVAVVLHLVPSAIMRRVRV